MERRGPLPRRKRTEGITMKTWKRLVSGLFALVLLASLAGSALAAETKAKTESAAAKPAGQFSQWFSNMGVNPEDPKASEAIDRTSVV